MSAEQIPAMTFCTDLVVIQGFNGYFLAAIKLADSFGKANDSFHISRWMKELLFSTNCLVFISPLPAPTAVLEIALTVSR